jgi:hypothetical protein
VFHLSKILPLFEGTDVAKLADFEKIRDEIEFACPRLGAADEAARLGEK